MAKDKHKKKKPKRHVTYNRKAFIAPKSINSMSAVHCKIYEDGRAIARLSDCHGSIRWWNDLNNLEEVRELVEKLDNAIVELQAFRYEVAKKDWINVK